MEKTEFRSQESGVRSQEPGEEYRTLRDNPEV
jgi:hypothetical protein